MRSKIVGYTAGAFDLFHIGHLNLLRRAKKKCDVLIVGVSTDEVVMETKKKKPIIPFRERLEIVNHVKFVDKVVPQTDLDKFKAWELLRYDLLFSGDDWKGDKRWLGYEKKLDEVGVKIIYFPYTRSTSSTKLASLIDILQGD